MAKMSCSPPHKPNGLLVRLSSVFRLHRHATMALLILVDTGVVFAAVVAAYALSVSRVASDGDWPRYISFAVLLALCCVPVFERCGLYRQQRSMMNLIEIRKILRSVLVVSCGMAAYSYFFQAEYPRIFLILAVVMLLLFLLSERMVFFKLQQRFRLHGFDVRRVLIIGAGEAGCLLYQSICHAPKLGYHVVGLLDADTTRLERAGEYLQGAAGQDAELFSDLSQLHTIITQQHIDEIFISNPFRDNGPLDIQSLATFCQHQGVQLNFLPYLRGYSSFKARVQDVNGISVISYGIAAPGGMEQAGKRVFDLVLSSCFLLLLLPVFAVLALLVRRDSKGPIFFRQTRVGKEGHLFSLYKFRTMYEEVPPYDFSPRSSQDPRITPIGRLLRKTSLDELPQLFNVIRGEMSLVGPRPEMPFIVEGVKSELYRQRLLVKPGITGIWQISSDRTREIHENISYDIFYIENRSILLDVIIIIRTVMFGVLAMRTH